MKHIDLSDYLKGNDYPGRGIIIGKSANGKYAVTAYFIMGRSENSRNRIFVETGDGIITQAHDPSKMTDPSLIIYAPVRRFQDITIVTNGDQTDTIYERLSRGGSYIDALRSREFEPDAPNYTPRISGLSYPDGSYCLSILKSAEGSPRSCRRYFYEYSPAVDGFGHFIHTYEGDGSPLPSFSGEPKLIRIDDDPEAFAGMLWGSLNSENKVSLYVCYTAAKERRQYIYNKNQE